MSAIAGPLAQEPLLGLRPNLWILLLGPSTIFRKSTSLAIAAKVLREVDDKVFLPTDFSPQSLVAEFSRRNACAGFLMRDEVSGFFHTVKRADFMAGVKELLIKLFDGDSFRRRLRHEEFAVNSPYFVWLGGAVTEKFLDAVTEEDVFSGLLIRFILVRPESKTIDRPLRYESPQLDDDREALVRELKAFRELLQEPWFLFLGDYLVSGDAPKFFVMGRETLARFNHFVEGLEKAGLKDPVVEKLNSRIGPLALKLMILFSLNHPDSLDLRLNTIQIDHRVALKSIHWADVFRQHLSTTLIGIGRTRKERLYEKALDLVRRTPGISRSRIMRRLRLNAQSMNDLEQTLIQRDLLEIGTRQGTRGSFYFLKEKTDETQLTQTGQSQHSC